MCAKCSLPVKRAPLGLALWFLPEGRRLHLLRTATNNEHAFGHVRTRQRWVPFMNIELPSVDCTESTQDASDAWRSGAGVPGCIERGNPLQPPGGGATGRDDRFSILEKARAFFQLSDGVSYRPVAADGAGLFPEACAPVARTPPVVRESDDKDVPFDGNIDQIVLEGVQGEPACPATEGRATVRKPP